MKTWAEIGAESRRKAKRVRARFESACPQCRAPIAIGQAIVNVWIPSGEFRGSNHNAGVWHCEDCAAFFQRGVDCGAMVGGLFLTIADQDAFNARPDVVSWKAEAAERSAREATQKIPAQSGTSAASTTAPNSDRAVSEVREAAVGGATEMVVPGGQPLLRLASLEGSLAGAEFRLAELREPGRASKTIVARQEHEVRKVRGLLAEARAEAGVL